MSRMEPPRNCDLEDHAATTATSISIIVGLRAITVFALLVRWRRSPDLLILAKISNVAKEREEKKAYLVVFPNFTHEVVEGLIDTSPVLSRRLAERAAEMPRLLATL